MNRRVVGMKEVMKHIGDNTLQRQLVRYHNSQARDKLQELSVYVQMLLARTENERSKRVLPPEVAVIVHDAESIVSHLNNAEMFANNIAQEKSREVVDQTITETEHLGSSVASMGVIGGTKKGINS